MAKQKMLCLAMVCYLSVYSADPVHCQEKMFGIGIGANLENSDSVAYRFSFQFNRTAAQEAEPGPYLRVWKGFGSRDVIALRPSAEANIGDDPETSPNNVIAQLALRWQIQTQTTQSWIVDLSPSFAADKNFDTKLAYGALGVKYLYYNHPREPRLYLIPGLRADYGRRSSETFDGATFHRLVPSLEAQVVFRDRITFTGRSLLYVIRNDEQVIRNGEYGYADISLDYRFAKQFGLEAKYVVGHEEPLFERVHALTVGFSLFR